MMIIRHKVRDYGQWRPIFDANAEMQKAAGCEHVRYWSVKQTSFTVAPRSAHDPKRTLAGRGVRD